jgi:quercetin dioxygenase-like cupin family protein
MAKERGVLQPLNVDQLQRGEVWGAEDASIHWKGGFFAYGGAGSEESATIYFELEPGKRLGRHTDTTEETQLILSGTGELRLDSGAYPMRPGDVIALTVGTFHDLVNTGTEPLRVVAFFAAPSVQQHWDDVVLPSNTKVTGSPNSF